MNILILLIAGLLFGYALIYKPHIIAIVLFVLIIANINLDIKSLPLNLRGIVSLSLFFRIVSDRSLKGDYPQFMSVGGVWAFLLFIGYTIFISASYGLFTMALVKQAYSTILSAFCAYHYCFKTKQYDTLKIAVICSGFVCFTDLAYTYIKFGSFPVQRLYEVFTGQTVDYIDPDDMLSGTYNHNFFGQICSMAFIFIFCNLFKNAKTGKLTAFLLPIMLLGVLMSTSRSAMLGLIMVCMIVVLNAVRHREQKKKVFKTFTLAIGGIVIAILLFSTLGMYFKLDSKFVDEVVVRLTDEPIAVVQKALGLKYNVQSLGSMDWREQASADAYGTYLNLEPAEQIFGIGQGGFLDRNLGHGLNPHNGILLILIETGIVGFLIYFLLLFFIIRQSILLKNMSPSVYVLLFTLVYGIGQNNELTSATTFLFVVTIIAELQSRLCEPDPIEDRMDYTQI